MAVAAGIATTIIGALGSVATNLISGYQQQQYLKQGEEASRQQYQQELAQRNKELAAQEKLTREQLRQQRAQFEKSMALSREQLSEQKNQAAHVEFQNQAKKLTSILSDNEGLKTLYINRLAGLRG
jgi:membrane-bound lytic murein transglycosylase